MSNYTPLTYHLVFATKYRRPDLVRPMRSALYAYIGGIIRGIEGYLIEINGVEDHVHILTHLPASMSIADTLRVIKSRSSKWTNESKLTARRFRWQSGYGAFTVSRSQIARVRRYIQNQEAHHRRQTFADEFAALLRRHA